MKKSLFFKRACLAVFCVMFGLAGMAQTTFTVDDLNYQVNPDGISVTLTGHVDGYNAVGELNVPESVSYEGVDYAVTNIGNSAFFQCEGFDGTLTIGESVKFIGNHAA